MPKVVDEVFTRPPWERMMRIHEKLKEGKYPNCSTLARDIEVSGRTIKRDLDFMKYRLSLPIEYDDKRYGYFYSQPVDRFPNASITEAELFALLVAHKAIVQYHGTQFQKPLETAFRKLTGQLDQQSSYSLGNLDQALSFRPFAPEDTDVETFQTLTRAVQKQQAVHFMYKNLGSRQAQKRHVHPYHLACIDNHWYLFAFDVNRNAMRTFVLTRLTKPQMTKKKFIRSKDFNPDEYLRGSFTVFKGGDDFEVVIDFDIWATDLIKGRTWHSTQQRTDLPNGSCRLSMRLNNIEEMERWVLSWGTHATVVRPRALAERISKTARALSGRYATV